MLEGHSPVPRTQAIAVCLLCLPEALWSIEGRCWGGRRFIMIRYFGLECQSLVRRKPLLIIWGIE